VQRHNIVKKYGLAVVSFRDVVVLFFYEKRESKLAKERR